MKNGVNAGYYNDFYVESYDGEITIIAYEGIESRVEIPSIIGDRPVRIIGKDAFSDKGLTAVVIPDTVRVIEDNAFVNNTVPENELVRWVDDDPESLPGFEFKDTWIVDPYLDESGRFEVDPVTFYGEENFGLWKDMNQELLDQKLPVAPVQKKKRIVGFER